MTVRHSDRDVEQIKREVDAPVAPSPRPEVDIVAAFVARTTEASGVPELLEDPAVIEQLATILRGAK